MSLPPCHSRRAWEGETEVFFCVHPRFYIKDHLVRAENCRACTYWRVPPPSEFRPFPSAPPRPRGRCLHLGEVLGLRECPTCSGSVRVKVFACHHPQHQETTLKACADCADHEAVAAEK